MYWKNLKHQLSRKEKITRKQVTQDYYEDEFEENSDRKYKYKYDAYNNIRKQENKNEEEISASKNKNSQTIQILYWVQ